MDGLGALVCAFRRSRRRLLGTPQLAPPAHRRQQTPLFPVPGLRFLRFLGSRPCARPRDRQPLVRILRAGRVRRVRAREVRRRCGVRRHARRAAGPSGSGAAENHRRHTGRSMNWEWHLLPALICFAYFLGGLPVFALATRRHGMLRDERVESRQSRLPKWLVYYLLWAIGPLERGLVRWRVRPNTLTFIGFALSFAAAAFV